MPHATDLDRIILDPLSEDAQNSPLELTGREAGHGVYLVEHDYPVPERKTSYVGSARSVGERKVAPGLPENRTIPVKLWAAEERGIEAGYNIVPNPSFETGTTGWNNGTGGGTRTRDAARAWSGEYSLRCDGAAGEVWGVFGPNVTVTGGFGYRITMRVYATDVHHLRVLLYDGVNAVGVATDTPRLDEGWNVVSFTGVAPYNSAGTSLHLRPEEVGSLGLASPYPRTYWIDAVGIIPYYPTAAELADGLNLAAFYPLDSATGAQDVSGNARDGTAQGGLTVGGAADGPQEMDASTDFDGTDDYLSTTYETRRNLAPNPRVATAIGNWTFTSTGWTGAGVTRSNLWAPTLPDYREWAIRLQGTHEATTASRTISAAQGTGDRMPVTAGNSFTCGFRAKVLDAPATSISVQVNFYDSGGGFLSTASGGIVNAPANGSIHTCAFNGTVPALATGAQIFALGTSNVSGDVVDILFTGFQFEEIGGALQNYFDGSGYAHPTFSNWIADTSNGPVGWLGTAHASASDYGCFANGTVRTFFGWVFADALPGSKILFASSSGSTTGFALQISPTGLVNLYMEVGAGLDVVAPAATIVPGEWAHIAVVIDEPNDDVYFYKNGTLIQTTTTVAEKYGQYAGSFAPAKYGGQFFDGKMAHVGVAQRGLSVGEITTIMAVTNPANTTATPDYFDGDTPGCVWGGTSHASASYRRPSSATGGKRFQAILSDLEKKIEKLAREGGTFKRYLPGGNPITFDVKEARIDIASARAAFSQGRTEVDLEFVCDPLGRGPESAVGADTAITGAPASSPVLTATLPSATVPGTYGARGRLVLDNDVAFDQTFLAWGIESRYFDKADPATKKLLLDSNDISTLGSATKAAGPTGAFGSGNNVIREGALGGSPAAFASTQLTAGGPHLEHVGAYRVWARVYRPSTNTGAVKLWLEWSQGDFRSYRKNAVKAWEAGESEATWQMIPLGIVRIPPAVAGTQKWEGRLIATSTQDGDDLDLDWIWLQPITEGSGRATAQSTAAAPSTFIVQDSFTRVGSLTGSVPNKGSTWAVVTTSDATDFSVLGTANRADTLDASLARGRLVSVGAASYASTRMKCEVTFSALPTTAASTQAGMFCRMVDIDNHVKVVLTTVGGLAVVKLIRVVALLGGASDLAAVVVGPSYTVTGTWNIEAEITAAGAWRLWVNNALVASGYDSNLSAAGGLATGRVGLIDVNTSSQSLTRYIGDFAAWQPVADAAAFASQSAEIRHDSAIREDSAGAIWTPISNYRGDFLLIPPAGLEKRGLRWTAKLARTDAEQADNDRDAASGQLYVTPLYDVVPEPTIL